MQLAHIELSKLAVSPQNMRAKRKDRDITDLIPSVRARGILVPLLVRPNGGPDTYEIVAGRRRFFAASKVSEERGEPMLLPCAVMEPDDDAGALEASLLENIARLDADEVTQWAVFARLVKLGRTVDDIGATFGIDDKIVRRVLALGNLLPRIRSLYQKEQIDAATVRHLTIATTAQQRNWLALHHSTEEYAPTGRALKDWLFGGSAVPTSAALFKLDEYTAPIISDLFGEERFFSDVALFWKFQNEAIEKNRQAYLVDGWSDVVLLQGGRWFDRWAYERRSKAKGGRVYIAVSEHGAVEIHEGYVLRKEAERLDRPESTSSAPPRPELSSPLRRYVDLHRHAVVRARLIDHPWIALRLLLAHAIAGSPLWQVRAERQRAEKPETAQSVACSRAEAIFAAMRAMALQGLGREPDLPGIIDRGVAWSVDSMFETLVAFPDNDVLDLAAVVIGESLDAASVMVELVGRLLVVDTGALWEADDAFFALLRDRKVVLALLTEVAGPETARANSDAPVKVLKAILRDCLDGRNGRTRVHPWAPRWMRFPSGTYLEGPSTEPVALPPDEQVAKVLEPEEFEHAEAAE